MANREPLQLSVLLHADVVGSTELVRRDEWAAHEEIGASYRRLAEAIGQYGGTTLERRGDALVARFERASDAVLAALAFQGAGDDAAGAEDADLRAKVRIGIALGEVVIADDTVTGAGIVLAQRLEQIARPGGVCISGAIREALPGRLPLDFEVLGEQALKGFPDPVQVYGVGLRAGEALPAGGARLPARPGRARRLAWIGAGGIAAVAAAAVVWTGLGERGHVRPEASARPSIAVLPFTDLSGDPEQRYFADGITEDLIGALGRYPSLVVKGYGAVQPFRGVGVDSAQAGQALGVRYLVEGSLRRQDDRLRAAVRLTDAATGAVLWSDRLDEQQHDVFALQDAITRRIAGTLLSRLTRVEQQRSFSKPTDSLTAYDLVLRGRAQLRLASRAGQREARRLFEEALAHDSGYAAAYSWLARAYYQAATDGWTEFPDEALQRAEELAGRALTIDPEQVDAHRTLARVHAIQFQLERALTEIDRAIALNPSDAEAHGDRGLILLWASKPEEAVRSLETAFAYDANLRSDYVLAYGLAYYVLGRYEDAVRVLERGAARYPNYAFIAAALVAAYGQLGRRDEADRNARRVKELLPFFDPQVFGSRFADKAHHDHVVEGLSKGGLR